MYDLGCMLLESKPFTVLDGLLDYIGSSVIVPPLVGYHCTCALINWSVLLHVILFLSNLLAQRFILIMFYLACDVFLYCFIAEVDSVVGDHINRLFGHILELFGATPTRSTSNY